MSTWKLPRSTPNLHHDWIAAAVAGRDATTAAQRAAVAARIGSLQARQDAADQATADAFRGVIEGMAEAARIWNEQIRTEIAPLFARMHQGLVDAGVIPPAPPADPRARALHARHTRNTGPARPPLDPRRNR